MSFGTPAWVCSLWFLLPVPAVGFKVNEKQMAAPSCDVAQDSVLDASIETKGKPLLVVGIGLGAVGSKERAGLFNDGDNHEYWVANHDFVGLVRSKVETLKPSTAKVIIVSKGVDEWTCTLLGDAALDGSGMPQFDEKEGCIQEWLPQLREKGQSVTYPEKVRSEVETSDGAVDAQKWDAWRQEVGNLLPVPSFNLRLSTAASLQGVMTNSATVATVVNLANETLRNGGTFVLWNEWVWATNTAGQSKPVETAKKTTTTTPKDYPFRAREPFFEGAHFEIGNGYLAELLLEFYTHHQERVQYFVSALDNADTAFQGHRDCSDQHLGYMPHQYNFHPDKVKCLDPVFITYGWKTLGSFLTDADVGITKATLDEAKSLIKKCLDLAYPNQWLRKFGCAGMSGIPKHWRIYAEGSHGKYFEYEGRHVDTVKKCIEDGIIDFGRIK